MSLGGQSLPFPIDFAHGPYHSSAACYSAVEISLLQRRDGQGPGKRVSEARSGRWKGAITDGRATCGWNHSLLYSLSSLYRL